MWQRGLLPQWRGWPPTQVHAGAPLSGGHREEGQSPQVRQWLSEQQGWASNLGRETSAPSPLGQKGKTQGPTSAPQIWGQTREEGGMTKWVQVLQGEVGVGLLCKLIMLMKCHQLCGGIWMWSQARREAGNLPSGLGSGWSREAAGLLPILPHAHLPGKPPRAPCFGLIELHGSTFILSFFLPEFSARSR